MSRTAPSFARPLAILLALSFAAAPAFAACAPEAGTRGQDAPPPVAQASVSPVVPADAPAAIGDDDRAALAALGRLEDADTALSLAADGAALYEREAVKLDGYA